MTRAEWFQFSKEDRSLKLKALLSELLSFKTTLSLDELKKKKKVKNQVYKLLDYEKLENQEL
jgi:hypothetical protein